MTSFLIEAPHLEILKKILLPLNVKVYAFGSRVTGKARRNSDLDLLIKEPITKSKLSLVKEALEESNLPYKVDIVIWDEISDAFKKQIEADLLLLDFGH